MKQSVLNRYGIRVKGDPHPAGIVGEAARSVVVGPENDHGVGANKITIGRNEAPARRSPFAGYPGDCDVNREVLSDVYSFFSDLDEKLMNTHPAAGNKEASISLAKAKIWVADQKKAVHALLVEGFNEEAETAAP